MPCEALGGGPGLVGVAGVRPQVSRGSETESACQVREHLVGQPAPCVVVVGMHRSGTSAIAGASPNLFGLRMPKASDLLVGFGNDRGHFESRALAPGSTNGYWVRRAGRGTARRRSSPAGSTPLASRTTRFAPTAAFRVAFGRHAGPVGLEGSSALARAAVLAGGPPSAVGRRARLQKSARGRGLARDPRRLPASPRSLVMGSLSTHRA